MQILQSSASNPMHLEFRSFARPLTSIPTAGATALFRTRKPNDMKTLTAATASLALLAAAPAGAQSIEITPTASRPSVVGSPQYFSGAVVVDPLFGSNAHTQTSGGEVSFAPGARSAWHTHPAGQTLVVTAGKGWVQAWGGEKRPIQAGDVVWIPPGVTHWHGAAATNSLRHIAIQEARDGSAVEWLELVSDAQYR